MRKLMLLFPAILVMALSLVACGGSPATPAATTQPPAASTITGDAAAGKLVFQNNCVVCHNADGSGGKQIGTATSADIRSAALTDTYKGDWSLVKRAILTGKDQDGQDLDAVMPRWQGKLSDTDVNNVIAYLQTLK